MINSRGHFRSKGNFTMEVGAEVEEEEEGAEGDGPVEEDAVPTATAAVEVLRDEEEALGATAAGEAEQEPFWWNWWPALEQG